MKLSMAEKIRLLLQHRDMPIKELSNKSGTTNQNMANKLKRNNFSMRELEEIATVLDCEFEASFIDKNGDCI